MSIRFKRGLLQQIFWRKKGTKRIQNAMTITVNAKPTNKYQPSSLVKENKTVLNLNIIWSHFNKFFTQIASKIDKKFKKMTKNPTRLRTRIKWK